MAIMPTGTERTIAVPSDVATLFVDTAFIFALVNERDEHHLQAVRWQRRLGDERRLLMTSEFVLTEIGDGLAAVGFRSTSIQVIDTLRRSSLVSIVPASAQLFAAALDLYRSRSDKDWGLTDCSSFVIMQDNGLTEALTTDAHFRQAGFRPVLMVGIA